MENWGSSIDGINRQPLKFKLSKGFTDVADARDVRLSDPPHSHFYRGGLPLNKNDLVAAVASRTGLSKTDSAKAVDGMVDAVTSALRGGGEVRLVGFGTFSVSHRKATTGRNPRTGEAIQIAATNVPKFKSGKALKQAVN